MCGGRARGVILEGDLGVFVWRQRWVCVCLCVCVERDCSERVGLCGHSGVWVQVETGVCV